MNLYRPPNLFRLLACLASGAVLVWIAPPVNLHWLHWVSFLPMFWAMRPGENRTNGLLAYAGGWLGNFLIFWWLVETVGRFSSLPWLVSLVVLVLFATVFSIPYGLVFGSVHWFRSRLGRAWVWVTPAVLVAVEKLGPALFPYYQGVSQYRNPYTWQLASVTGVWGLSYLVLLVNAALAEGLIYGRREGLPQPVKTYAAVALLFVANLGFGVWRFGTIDTMLATAPVLRVAQIQENVTMEERLRTPGREELSSWLKLTRQLEGQEVDLVVWPEGALPYNPTDPKLATLLGKMAREGNYDFLVGGGTYELAPAGSDRKYNSFNSCYLVNKQGEIAGRYDKMVPLPFGEYVPFSDTFPFLKDIVEGPGDFRKGVIPTVFHADGYTFTTPICYEAILDSQMWKQSGADLFVNITNDAWFGDTGCPYQHAMLAAVQATTFGRPLVRSAYTGISFMVEPHGRILHETKPFEEVARVEPLRLARIETLYTRGGWVFSWLCVAGTAGAVLLGRRRVSSPSA